MLKPTETNKTYTLQELRELFGPECSGKTTIGVRVVQEALKNGGATLILDREHSLDPALLTALGVALDTPVPIERLMKVLEYHHLDAEEPAAEAIGMAAWEECERLGWIRYDRGTDTFDITPVGTEVLKAYWGLSGRATLP